VPPPAGETDIYEAKTQVGGLPPEAMALLRQLREGPDAGRSIEEANVPVFVEDSGATSDAAPGSGRRAAAPIRPAAGAPIAKLTPAPIAVEPPSPDYSVLGSSSTSHVSPSNSARAADLASPQPPPSAPPADPRPYASVFAPLAAEAPAAVAPLPPSTPGASSRSPIVIVGVLVALLIVVLAQAGMIPGLAPLGPTPVR
jgi:hypothetical protein